MVLTLKLTATKAKEATQHRVNVDVDGDRRGNADGAMPHSMFCISSFLVVQCNLLNIEAIDHLIKTSSPPSDVFPHILFLLCPVNVVPCTGIGR